MTKSKYRQPTFHLALLHPKYWGVWFGFGLLALLVNLLPYALLLPIGRGLGQVSMRFGQARVKVARRNLALAFPAMSESEIHALVLENFKNTGAALIETGIAWFWPTCRFKQIVIDQDTQALRRHAEQGKGVLLCCVHALNLEIAARGFGVLGMGGYGVYRPHNNPAYNF
ncbi:MAG: lipid A biosynthesis lauroyl acyltransferase, partial [Vibrio sp.]